MISGVKRSLRSTIEKRFPALSFQEDFSFGRHTTIGCGGVAALAVSPSDTEQTAKLLGFLAEEEIPYCYLGAGANVLPADGFWEGVVVRFHRLGRLECRKNELFIGAGVTGGRLLCFARANAMGGMEPFTGIPMSVGGGITMNAGIAVRHFSDIVEDVTAIVDGKVVKFSKEECGFSEKTSVFQKGIAVVEARIRLTPSDAETILRESAYFRARRSSLPKGRSMGCTFVNPKGVSAGALIDECGLKGYSRGRAFVSSVHANFIINEGTCSADVEKIIATIQRTVFEKKRIFLREEIKRLPLPHT